MKPTAESFEFTVEQITEAADTWFRFPQFCGETCCGCGKTANVLLGPGWICVCGQFNAQHFYGGSPQHAKPDLGPPAEVIREGLGKSKKWQCLMAAAAIANREDAKHDL